MDQLEEHVVIVLHQLPEAGSEQMNTENEILLCGKFNYKISFPDVPAETKTEADRLLQKATLYYSCEN